MKRSPTTRIAAGALAAGLLLAPTGAGAILPIVAMLARQMVQDAVTTRVKEMLLGSLRGTGCKGIALANALQSLDVRPGAAGLAGKLPEGLPNPRGMPAGMALPNATGAMGAVAIPPEMAGLLGGLAPNMAALPPGVVLDDKAMAMLAQMQAGMRAPASPAETAATLDELAELGFLPAAMQAELKDCMALLPQSAPAMGMALGMLKPMLPQLREARAQMQALSPDEQDEMAATMAGELQSVPAEERKAFADQMGGGFFPPRVVEGVKARLGAK